MCASQDDQAVIGKGFKGALDYLRFSFKPTAEPTVTYTGKEAPEITALRGDINKDGKCGKADAVLLLQYLLTAETALPDWNAGDLDNNGRLNADDLTLLKGLLLHP